MGQCCPGSRWRPEGTVRIMPKGQSAEVSVTEWQGRESKESRIGGPSPALARAAARCQAPKRGQCSEAPEDRIQGTGLLLRTGVLSVPRSGTGGDTPKQWVNGKQGWPRAGCVCNCTCACLHLTTPVHTSIYRSACTGSVSAWGTLHRLPNGLWDDTAGQCSGPDGTERHLQRREGLRFSFRFHPTPLSFPWFSHRVGLFPWARGRGFTVCVLHISLAPGPSSIFWNLF